MESPSSPVPRSLRTVLIAVPTTGRRPLTELLGALAGQARAVRSGVPSVSILLIDNSGGGGSEQLRSQAAASGVEYMEVRTRGFAQVRNAALEAARPYDAVVFIDDDEMPVRGWLEALTKGAQTYGADVVTGPVPIRMPRTAPQWLGDGAILRPQASHPDGPLRGTAASGNTLVRMSTVEALGLRFNPAFDRTGGEDTAFFTELALSGAGVVWVGAAVAFETPDLERLTLTYVMRRWYRSGVATALVERAVGPPPSARGVVRRAGRLARGMFWIGRGALRRNQGECAEGLTDLAFACGWWLTYLLRRRVTDCRSVQSHA